MTLTIQGPTSFLEEFLQYIVIHGFVILLLLFCLLFWRVVAFFKVPNFDQIWNALSFKPWKFSQDELTRKKETALIKSFSTNSWLINLLSL